MLVGAEGALVRVQRGRPVDAQRAPRGDHTGERGAEQ